MEAFITAITENLPAIAAISLAAVALLKAIAVVTPSNVDNKIVDVLAKIVSYIPGAPKK